MNQTLHRLGVHSEPFYWMRIVHTKYHLNQSHILLRSVPSSVVTIVLPQVEIARYFADKDIHSNSPSPEGIFVNVTGRGTPDDPLSHQHQYGHARMADEQRREMWEEGGREWTAKTE